MNYSDIQKKYGVAMQSHLSENQGEIEWVKELCPNTKFFGEAYDQFGLFGGENCPTIMAHCVYSSEEELDLIEKRGVWMILCPQSNMNVATGIAPARKYLERGLKQRVKALNIFLKDIYTKKQIIKESNYTYRDALEVSAYLIEVGKFERFYKEMQIHDLQKELDEMDDGE